MTENEAIAAIHDRPFHELSKEELGSTAPYSRRQLETKLKELSGAESAEIDPGKSTFSFHYLGDGSGLWFGPPWSFLEHAPKAVTEPWADAEALFNKDGLVRMSDEEAAFHERQHQSVSKAGALVFRQIMLRSFAQAVAASSVKLHAQIGSVSGPFRQLPATVWPLLDVRDRENGVAIAPDGTRYWSIHVAGTAKAKVYGRPRSGSGVIKFVRNYFDSEKAAGRPPTSAGCEKAARDAGIEGHRKEIRKAFRDCQPSGILIRPGRPRKSPK
jgi:hypothetical protein